MRNGTLAIWTFYFQLCIYGYLVAMPHSAKIILCSSLALISVHGKFSEYKTPSIERVKKFYTLGRLCNKDDAEDVTSSTQSFYRHFTWSYTIDWFLRSKLFKDIIGPSSSIYTILLKNGVSFQNLSKLQISQKLENKFYH